jgi:hypothetical protein
MTSDTEKSLFSTSQPARQNELFIRRCSRFSQTLERTKVCTSPLHSLRTCWTAFLNVHIDSSCPTWTIELPPCHTNFPSMLDTTPFRWAASVVRNRSHITNHMDSQSSSLKRSDRRFTTGPRPIHIDIHCAHSTLHRLPSGSLASPLSGKWRTLSRALEPLVP